MDDRARITLRLPGSLRRIIDTHVKDKKGSLNDWIMQALQDEVDRIDGRDKAVSEPLAVQQPVPIVPLSAVRWDKSKEGHIHYAYTWNHRQIGYIDNFAAAATETWRWVLPYCKPTAFVFTEGECQTLQGAKRALLRSWNAWIAHMGLVSNPPPSDEFIAAAAIVHAGRTWSVPIPGRHGDVVKLIADKAPDTLPVGGGSAQGFITNTGRFVERVEAGQIALKAQQTPTLQWGPNLFSEDLW